MIQQGGCLGAAELVGALLLLSEWTSLGEAASAVLASCKIKGR